MNRQDTITLTLHHLECAMIERNDNWITTGGQSTTRNSFDNQISGFYSCLITKDRQQSHSPPST